MPFQDDSGLLRTEASWKLPMDTTTGLSTSSFSIIKIDDLQIAASGYVGQNSLWPCNSPNLNSMDYSVWSILEKAHSTHYASVDPLKCTLKKVWDKFTVKKLVTIIDHFSKRLRAESKQKGAFWELIAVHYVVSLINCNKINVIHNSHEFDCLKQNNIVRTFYASNTRLPIYYKCYFMLCNLELQPCSFLVLMQVGSVCAIQITFKHLQSCSVNCSVKNHWAMHQN